MMRHHPRRRRNLGDGILRWLDDHPVYARLYVPIAVTINFLVTLITELPSPRR